MNIKKNISQRNGAIRAGIDTWTMFTSFSNGIQQRQQCFSFWPRRLHCHILMNIHGKERPLISTDFSITGIFQCLLVQLCTCDHQHRDRSVPHEQWSWVIINIMIVMTDQWSLITDHILDGDITWGSHAAKGNYTLRMEFVVATRRDHGHGHPWRDACPGCGRKRIRILNDQRWWRTPGDEF